MVPSLILCCLAVAAGSADGESYPFAAEVILDQAEVQAGNGRRFYTTDRLSAGTIVEVHRRDPGGWLAIRPPAGSFSWVPAVQVQPTEQADIVEVVSEEAVSWIGSKTDKVKEHRFEVRLKPGERLQVLGQKQVIGTSGAAETWYKIAPPMGEFRWIHSRELTRVDALASPASNKTPSSTGSKIASVAQSDSSPAAVIEPNATSARTADVEATFRPRSKVALTSLQEPYPERTKRFDPLTNTEEAPFADEFQPASSSPIRPVAYEKEVENIVAKEPELQEVRLPDDDITPVSGDGFVPRGSRPANKPDDSYREPLPFISSASRLGKSSLGTSSSSVPIVGAGVSPGKTESSSSAEDQQPAAAPLKRTDLELRLTELEADLTVMLAQDPKSWKLPAIRARAEQLIEQSPTAADRGRVRLLIDKIHSFATAFNVEDDPRFAGPTVDVNAPAEPEVPKAVDPKYDGVGWLKPVVSRQRPAAPYALVDGEGKPLAFVTPAPGMNLNRYLNRPLGVYGRRGYIESLQSPHIVAERVIDLGRHLR